MTADMEDELVEQLIYLLEASLLSYIYERPLYFVFEGWAGHHG